MAKKPSVHVSSRENGWAVVREGNDRATSVHRTQAEAAREGRGIARRRETGFLLHGKDGRIREHNDYGSGQHPQEGMSTGRATENFAPGTRALGETTTNEEGQTVQRTTDDQGDIVETAFDAEGDVVDEIPVGSLADLPGAEGYEETADEEGTTKRIVKDESGTLIELRIGPDGSVLDLRILPGTEKVEETTRQVGQAAQGAQDAEGQTADRAQDAKGRAAGRARNDAAGGAAEQAQNASGQRTDQDRRPAGQTAGQGEERAEGQGPNATPAARRKAEEMGVDLSRTGGTGSGGRITAKDVTGMAGRAHERADGGTPQQDEEQRAEERHHEAEGGAQDAAGQATDRAVRGVQDATQQVTEQAQGLASGLVGGLAGRGGQQDEERGRGGSQEEADRAADQPGRAVRGTQDTAGRAAARATVAAGGATPQARDTAGQAAQRADQGEPWQDGDRRLSGGGQEHDAPDAAERQAGGVDVGSSKVEGSGARGRVTGNEAKDLSGPAGGGTAREHKKSGQAGQAAQKAGDTAGQAAEEAGEATRRAAGAVAGPAAGDANRTADRSRRAATEVARGGGIPDGRTDGTAEVRGMAAKGRDDGYFEMIGEGYADHEVYDRDGERLGKVGHLFLGEDDQLEYVGVEIGLPDGRAVLVPVEVIPADEERRRMVVSRPKSVAERSPTFGDEEEVPPGFEGRVHSHYGLPSRSGTGGRSNHEAALAAGLTQREREGSGAVGAGPRTGGTEASAYRGHDREPGGFRQTGGDLEDGDELKVRRSEEELRVGIREREAGAVNVRKRVRTYCERLEVPTRREEVSVERVPVGAEASGTEIGEEEISVPVTEEEAVVDKRPVAKEEVRIRKDVEEGTKVAEEGVRREEIEIDDQTERRTR